ncbi:MAG: Rpn family recombination-promoting nuclease/putative transposase [Gammaproteobacteria bacterium]|nr:Rpn family recombination-promoting nuclease/putative transposase [Gammaproteobacteria bacterium]
MKFLDVKTDYAFKRVFGSQQSKPLLIEFLNALLDYPPEQQIVELEIVDPYQIPLLKGMKDSFVDVKATLSNGSQVIIEMQVLNVPGFEQRILYNAAKQYSVQLKQGEDYHLLNPVIAITFTDFTLFSDEKLKSQYISHYKLIEKSTLVEYKDDIELIFIELPKFTLSLPELTDIRQKWIWFVQNAGKLNTTPEQLNSLGLKLALELSNESSLTEEELEIQQKRRDFIWMQRGSLEKAHQGGRQEGLKEGREDGLNEALQRLIESGMNESQARQILFGGE